MDTSSTNPQQTVKTDDSTQQPPLVHDDALDQQIADSVLRKKRIHSQDITPGAWARILYNTVNELVRIHEDAFEFASIMNLTNFPVGNGSPLDVARMTHPCTFPSEITFNTPVVRVHELLTHESRNKRTRETLLFSINYHMVGQSPVIWLHWKHEYDVTLRMDTLDKNSKKPVRAEIARSSFFTAIDEDKVVEFMRQYNVTTHAEFFLKKVLARLRRKESYLSSRLSMMGHYIGQLSETLIMSDAIERTEYL
jgi:hypothetical protein